jgi:hypothetical protein
MYVLLIHLCQTLVKREASENPVDDSDLTDIEGALLIY